MNPLVSFSDSERRLLYRLLAVLAIIMVVLYFVAPRHKAGTASFAENYHLSFPNYDGERVTLISFRLKPLIVYSWASWSPYSAEQFVSLRALKQKLGDSVHIVAINRGEPLAEARAFTDKLDLGTDIVLLLDPDDAYYASIGGYAMPETLFISASGDERLHQRGPLSVEALEAGLQSAL